MTRAVKMHPNMSKPPLQHALSVDVEDWNNLVVFHKGGRLLPPTDAVVRNTEILLDLVLEHKAQATWFMLGEVAEAFPGLVRRLADAGQEVGVHGFHHVYVSSLSEEAFRDSIRRAKHIIEQTAGTAVLGHRAPAFSITNQVPWAFDVLAELGFSYDSSVFPAKTRRYGDNNAPLRPYPIQTRHGELTEVPLSVVKLGPWRLPCCGGGYLRHFPLTYTRWSIRKIEREERSVVVYLHPHEIDPSFDREYVSRHLGEKKLAAIRWNIHLQYRNRAKTVSRLRYLLTTRRFAGIARVFHLECPKRLLPVSGY
jgi:polysaccharide deacetylase family protein (PEP-CTERM system associated)